MRYQVSSLFLLAAALLLANTDSGVTGRRIVVRANNARVEITGSDSDGVQVNETSHATVMSENGRVVVEAGADGEPMKLQVPRLSSLEVITSNGSIHVAGVTGALRLDTSNGEIVARDAGASEIHAHTSNGSIRISVPAGINADVSAHTSNGQVHSELEVTAHHLGGTFLEGKIGRGGTALDLQTSNGLIFINGAGEQESVTSSFKPDKVK